VEDFHEPEVLEDGNNLHARKEMLLASCYAGIAFSNSSTNLAHATGRALGALFNIPHGLSVSLLLPFVMRFGLESAPDRYADITFLIIAAEMVYIFSHQTKYHKVR
jgi:alcohol dehydrogenase class IV